MNLSVGLILLIVLEVLALSKVPTVSRCNYGYVPLSKGHHDV